MKLTKKLKKRILNLLDDVTKIRLQHSFMKYVRLSN